MGQQTTEAHDTFLLSYFRFRLAGVNNFPYKSILREFSDTFVGGEKSFFLTFSCSNPQFFSAEDSKPRIGPRLTWTTLAEWKFRFCPADFAVRTRMHLGGSELAVLVAHFAESLPRFPFHKTLFSCTLEILGSPSTGLEKLFFIFLSRLYFRSCTHTLRRTGNGECTPLFFCVPIAFCF